MTSIAFNPANSSPPFTATFILDGVPHAVTGTWNLYAQRWYLNIVSSDSDLIWSGPIVGSPESYDIELAPGIFTESKIIFRADTGIFEITP